MRLWSLHPKYLDSKGIVALWREALLAKKVLEGNTRGYIHHPQLIRFKLLKDPLKGINEYLKCILEEARERNYHFNESKVLFVGNAEKISVSTGQIEYEFLHLLRKLELRSPEKFNKINKTESIELHPLFSIREGPIEKWEKNIQ